ncbi:MAG: hypothetical protein WDW36_009521 [Sanguina aurantia]
MGLHVVWLLAALAFSPLCTGVLFDPCAPMEPVKRGTPMPLGLMFIPGGNATEIDALIAANNLGLCDYELKAYMISKFRARVAIYNLVVDRLSVLTVKYLDVVIAMSDLLAQDLPITLTVIAFRGNVSSPTAYIASADSSYSHGTGFVISLAALLRFSTGVLNYIQWYDLTCEACDGNPGAYCMHNTGSNACATPLSNCTCTNSTTNATIAGCNFSQSRFDICATTVNVGFSGTDKYAVTFVTGTNIQRLNAFSLVSLFNKVADQYSYYSGIVTAAASVSWNSISTTSNGQYANFGTGFGESGFGGDPPPPRPPPAPPPPPPSSLCPPPYNPLLLVPHHISAPRPSFATFSPAGAAHTAQAPPFTAATAITSPPLRPPPPSPPPAPPSDPSPPPF